MDEDVLGLEILVDDALSVEVGDGARNANGELEELLHRHRGPEEPVEGLLAAILEHQRWHPLIRLERERPDDRPEIERRGGLVLVS